MFSSKRLSVFIFCAVALGIFLLPHVIFAAATLSISSAIPGSNDTNASGTSPAAFIANFYQLALMLGGVLAFGAIVYGGFLYAVSGIGNPSKHSEGKELIQSALIGLLLLAGAYFILYIVNPNLVSLNLPELTKLGAVGNGGGSGNSGGSGTGDGNASGGSSCQAPSAGPCSDVANLSCFGGAAGTMQSICNRESGGNAGIPSGVDIGADGNPVSFGLFQINISATTLTDPKTGKTLPCNTAFTTPYTATNHSTKVTNPALYQQCVALAKDPTANISNACSMSKGGTYLVPWQTTTNACGI